MTVLVRKRIRDWGKSIEVIFFVAIFVVENFDIFSFSYLELTKLFN
jgi:hypothetical protein